MRKLLGLFVAVAFVATAASSVFAASSSTFFKAELSFASTYTAFGFQLLKMAGNKPAAGDAVAPKIDWEPGFRALQPGNSDGITYGPGQPQTWFSNSKVYAKLTVKSLAPGTTVKFYTDNQNGTASATTYKANATLLSTMAFPLTVMKGSVPIDAPGLPLAYRVVDSSKNIALTTATPSAGVAYNTITSIDQIDLNIGQIIYGLYATVDKKNPTFTADAGEYAIIATDQGLRTGYGALPGEIHYAYPTGDAYFFFATSAFDAKVAHRYGTDKLTLEVITE
ncbi:exported protein of unknown function [Endomicrobium proavitum]|uniref:DUF4198 domain-containing protein n=2 Tax=Endomicrobium proavitum TaxID=1408281 RepID=A0A0G3WH72_9BACT|nr:exported protein of unknown function [Endomicrobium proavitum]